MARSVLAQRYKTKTKTSSSKNVRSAYGVENPIPQKSKQRRQNKNKHISADPEDEELDMEALAEYVEELKEYMHGNGSIGGSSSGAKRKSYAATSGSFKATKAIALKENNNRLNKQHRNSSTKKKMTVHEMSKVKKKVYSALNRADIAIQQQMEKASVPGHNVANRDSTSKNSKVGQRRQRSRVSASSLKPRLHRHHTKKRAGGQGNRSSWNDALAKLTAEKIAWFETVTYVAPGKSGRLKKCSANREIVNDAFAGDPYAGFRSQILNLPKPNRNAVAKQIIKANAAKFKKRSKVNKVRGKGQKGFGAGKSRPALPGHPGYISAGL